MNSSRLKENATVGKRCAEVSGAAMTTSLSFFSAFSFPLREIFLGTQRCRGRRERNAVHLLYLIQKKLKRFVQTVFEQTISHAN
jgi:hypothetical protein